jgi:hypothetical protein
MLWSQVHDDYLDIVDRLPDLIDQVKDFSEPGLGSWDLAGLSGHLLRAVRTPVRYLADPEPMDGPGNGAAQYLAAYLERRQEDPSLDDVVAQRGTGEIEGIDPDQFPRLFRTAAASARAALQGIQGDRKVGTPHGTYRIQDYLRTRTFEAVVHSLDVAHAAGIEWRPPQAAVNDALLLLVDLAHITDQAERLLLALTGRIADTDGAPLSLLR